MDNECNTKFEDMLKMTETPNPKDSKTTSPINLITVYNGMLRLYKNINKPFDDFRKIMVSAGYNWDISDVEEVRTKLTELEVTSCNLGEGLSKGDFIIGGLTIANAIHSKDGQSYVNNWCGQTDNNNEPSVRQWLKVVSIILGKEFEW